ncbi:MAG: hypothetical protein HOV76_07925 [Hamadaea sp.]|nr:hypothetical protein [Hamadaea sp.]
MRIVGLIGVAFAGLAALTLVADLPSPAATWAVLGVIAVGYLVVVVRLLLLPRSCWVRVTPEAIAWRTPVRQRRAATESGTVALTAVTSAAVSQARFSAVRTGATPGYVLTLRTADGVDITLPIWSPAVTLGASLKQLLAAVRAVAPALPVDLGLLAGTRT